MGKKKKGKGYGSIVLTVVLISIIAFAGVGFAEQEWLPGYGDKNGTLGKNGQSWRIGYINTLALEGPTSNGFETFLSADDPTADNRLLLPDESGTLLSTGGLTGVIPLSDTTVLIGNSAGLGVEQSVSLINDVTGSLLNSGIINTTIPASTITSAMILDATILNSDISTGGVNGTNILDSTITTDDILAATILNTDIATGGVNGTNILDATIAAADIGSDAVGLSELNIITVNVPILNTATSGTATVTAGSFNWGAYAFANVDSEVANSTSISSTTLTVTLNAAANVIGAVIFRVPVLAP